MSDSPEAPDTEGGTDGIFNVGRVAKIMSGTVDPKFSAPRRKLSSSSTDSDSEQNTAG